jgi:hypothetical protein
MRAFHQTEKLEASMGSTGERISNAVGNRIVHSSRSPVGQGVTKS